MARTPTSPRQLRTGLAVFGVLTVVSVTKLALDYVRCLGDSVAPLSWSPDGRWIVAEQYRSASTEYSVVLVSAATGRVERLLYKNENGTRCRSARFSPDSRSIAYHVADDYFKNPYTLKGIAHRHHDHVVDLEGRVTQELVGTGEVQEETLRRDSPDGHWSASWEPESETSNANWNFLVRGPDGTRVNLLKTYSQLPTVFTWRPSGELVYIEPYVEPKDMIVSVVAYNPKTQQRRELVNLSSYESLVFSPDGSQLAQTGTTQVQFVRLGSASTAP
ncbi:PD40 domain-containing protein [Armatimonas rosea]|uniref:Tol biopolymer transport system component n=1 Tax=Armatimonas rosea TaxID=685828 RepID=A0A7W9SVT5_ARMRO|nr:PD40 domain-containing protein [Armatimonas rosea]MBB6053631.1 Tol biopolymer transport system component [Armatimonas rosea]